MTRIIGTIKDAIAPLDGELIVTLDERIIDTSTQPNTIHTQEPARFSVTDGTIDFDLSPSGDTTYRFQFALINMVERFYSLDGQIYTGPWHEHEGDYYKGLTHSAESELLTRTELKQERIIQDFHAKVPHRDQAIEYSDLLPTGVTKSLLDSSVSRIVDLLSTNANFLSALELQFSNATNIAFSPYGEITSENVQAAIQQSQDKTLSSAQNLADVTSKSTARVNLGLGSAALSDTSSFAPNEHSHLHTDILFTQVNKGGGQCAIGNAPPGVYGQPDKWLIIQSLDSHVFVVPAWKLS